MNDGKPFQLHLADKPIESPVDLLGTGLQGYSTRVSFRSIGQFTISVVAIGSQWTGATLRAMVARSLLSVDTTGRVFGRWPTVVLRRPSGSVPRKGDVAL